MIVCIEEIVCLNQFGVCAEDVDRLYKGDAVFVTRLLCAECFESELQLLETIVMRWHAGYKLLLRKLEQCDLYAERAVVKISQARHCLSKRREYVSFSQGPIRHKMDWSFIESIYIY